MVKNADGDSVDQKPSFVDHFIEIKLPKIKVEALMKVVCFRVNSDMSNLRDNEVGSTLFFFNPRNMER